MGARSDVERHRKAIQTLQSKIASESAKAAKAREKEAKARQQAEKSSTPSAAASRSREAERQNKTAVEAEKRRSRFERDLAAKQRALHQAETKLSKEEAKERERSLKRLEDRALTAERQFRGFDAPGGMRSTLAQSEVVVTKHDVFISHAYEDKEEVARPLADLLVERSVVVWYDEFSLTVGDSLRRSIDRGLASSRFGVVVLSPDFFNKEWPKAELDGLVAKQRAHGGKVLLPIWHRITKDDVLEQSPTLADLKALNTSVMTLAEIANEIAAVVTGD